MGYHKEEQDLPRSGRYLNQKSSQRNGTYVFSMHAAAERLNIRALYVCICASTWAHMSSMCIYICDHACMSLEWQAGSTAGSGSSMFLDHWVEGKKVNDKCPMPWSSNYTDGVSLAMWRLEPNWGPWKSSQCSYLPSQLSSPRKQLMDR